jgi:putative oxidoreductase
MDDLKLTLVEEHRGALQTWLPRIGVAGVFFFIGKGKFAAQSHWVGIFDQIGFGQWFRYFTGVLQAGGALLVLIPRTFPIGILVLACTMLGAMAAWIFLLGAPFNALIPAIILGGLLVVGGEDLIGLFYRRKQQ